MEYFGITDKGRVRPTNQDIYRLEVRPEKESAFVLVCDGMGGANAGNVASRFAADSFLADAAGALDSAPDEIMRHKTMLHALEKANDTVFGLAGRQPEFRGMGHDARRRVRAGQGSEHPERRRQPRVPL